MLNLMLDATGKPSHENEIVQEWLDNKFLCKKFVSLKNCELQFLSMSKLNCQITNGKKGSTAGEHVAGIELTRKILLSKSCEKLFCPELDHDVYFFTVK